MMRQRHINYDSRGCNDNVNMKKNTVVGNVVNLSRLSMSKGKFSLSNKYNSTHNNHHQNFNSKKHPQPNHQIIKQQHCQYPHSLYQTSNTTSMGYDYCQTQRYVSDQQQKKQQINNYNNSAIITQKNLLQESNKQNISSHANINKALSTKNTLFAKHNHQRQLPIYAAQSNTYQHYEQNNDNYDDQNQQSRIQQIRGIASHIVQQEKKHHNPKKQPNNRNNNFKQKDSVNTNTINNNNNIQRRRSKFHKYDNINSQNNQFLFIETDQPTQILDKDIPIKATKKQNIKQQEKKKEQESSRQQMLVIQELKISLKSIEINLKSKESQLQQYKQSMKQISYSMIRMISLMSKFQQRSGRYQQQSEGISCMRLLRKQIAQLYTKQLVHYIDKLHIRQQLVELAQRESHNNNNISRKAMNQHANDCTFVNDDDDDDKENPPLSSQLFSHNACNQQQSSIFNDNDDNDSLYNYELTSVSQHHNKSKVNNHLHDQNKNHNQNPSRQSQFDFNSINQLELQLAHSGRNLLDTFNHEHLKQQLDQFNSDNVDYGDQENYKEKSESYTLQQQQDVTNSNIFSTAKQQMLAENLHYALMRDANHDVQSYSISNNNISNQPINVCRKLFQENDNNQLQQKQAHPIKIQNQISTTNQKVFPQNDDGVLRQEHCYKLIKSINYNEQQTTSNYLKLQIDSVFKLLRKVDSNRWIAECNDKIGFILQASIVGRLKMQQMVEHYR